MQSSFIPSPLALLIIVILLILLVVLIRNYIKKKKKAKADLANPKNAPDSFNAEPHKEEASFDSSIQKEKKLGKIENNKSGTTKLNFGNNPAMQDQNKNATKIFISYRRSESADITGRIYDRLVQHFGREQIFKDVDSIPLGMDFRDHMNQNIQDCTVFLAVIGNQWVNVKNNQGSMRLQESKDHVRIEVESALNNNIPVIPILVKRAAMPSETDLPPSISDLAFRNGLSVRVDPDFHNDVDRLIAGIEQLLVSNK